MRPQALLRAQRVDRQLKGAASIGRPSQLVIDQTKRAVVEEIQTIDFAGERDRPRAVGGRERELAAQVVFEPEPEALPAALAEDEPEPVSEPRTSVEPEPEAEPAPDAAPEAAPVSEPTMPIA